MATSMRAGAFGSFNLQSSIWLELWSFFALFLDERKDDVEMLRKLVLPVPLLGDDSDVQSCLREPNSEDSIVVVSASTPSDDDKLILKKQW